jgi:tetratricopeptide (TPR) repeat protein
VRLDQYLAVAYFQQGVSNFLMGDFEEALANFNDTLLYLRGNNNIDYEQLGLKFKLYSCEVLFNRGLCYIYLQQRDAGLQDLSFAAKEKVVPDHDVIDEAIREEAEVLITSMFDTRLGLTSARATPFFPFQSASFTVPTRLRSRT